MGCKKKIGSKSCFHCEKANRWGLVSWYCNEKKEDFFKRPTQRVNMEEEKDKEKEKGSMKWIAYSVMWISAAVAACVGAYVTKSAYCMLVMIIPAFVKFHDKEELISL